MSAKLNKLRSLLRPMTEAQARERMKQFDAKAPDEPSFLYGLEADNHPEFLTKVQALQREEMEQAQAVMHY